MIRHSRVISEFSGKSACLMTAVRAKDQAPLSFDGAPEGTILWLRNFGKRKSDSEKRVAGSIDGVANLGVDGAGFAPTRQPPVVFGCAGWKRRIRSCHRRVVGMPGVHEEFVQRLPVSGIRHRGPR